MGPERTLGHDGDGWFRSYLDRGLHLTPREHPADFSKGKRGPVVRIPLGKTRVTIRLDDDLLAWFRNEVERAGGGNYQSLINLALRDFVDRSREPLESTLRRVIREELKRAG